MSSITIETSRGVSNEERQLPLTVEGVRSAIQALDGDRTTVATLGDSGGTDSFMMIGGGPDKFVVDFAIHNSETDLPHFYSLIMHPKAEGTEARMFGGNLTDLPVRSLVCREAAEKVAIEFAETGTVRLDENWEDDEAYTA